MISIKNILWQILSIIPVEIVVLVFYSKITMGFFQQDEWLSFARHFILREEGILALLKDAFLPSVGHYQPLNTLTIHSLFSVFGLNYIGYVFTSITLHLINLTIIFLLAKKIFKGLLLPVIVIILFGISASIYQATSWVLADIGVHFATIFSLLCLLFFFEFLSNKKTIHFYLSLVFLIISLAYKEIALGLFLLLPITYFLFGNIKKKKYPIITIGIGAFYLLFRVAIIFLPQSYTRDILATQSQSIQDILYNFLTFPSKAITQLIIPSNVLLDFSYFIGSVLPTEWTGYKYTTIYDKFVEGVVLEFIIILFSIFIILTSVYFWSKEQNHLIKNIIILSLILIILNSPIFALAPEKSGVISLIDSRNLYFLSIGSSFLLGSILGSSILGRFSKVGIFILLIMLNSYWLNFQINKVAENGLLRKSVLKQIKKDYPKLPDRVVFYTESDKSYYGLPADEQILPFQSGLGQTLLIWYYPTENFPIDFLKNRFLWEIRDQGYKEIEGRGFGYFRNFDLLKKTVKDYNIDLNSIVGFSWRSKTNTLLDISSEAKERLKK